MTEKKTATSPFYAVVGATDLVVERARSYTADVQARVAEVQSRVGKIDLEPSALRDQARTLVASRPQVEAYVNDAVAEVTEAYGDLAARGHKLLQRVRGQQSTQEAQAAARTTVAKAKTARTQTAGSAKGTAATGKTAAKSTGRKTTQSAKRTAGTAKSNAKATSTSARKATAATTEAAGDAAEKVGD